MAEEPQGLTPEELETQDAAALPDREAMSTLDPTAGLDPAGTVGDVTDAVGGTTDTVGGLTGTPGLLDLDVNVDLTADAAAPVNAGVAANANVAAPIDAAVSANIASPDATSAAVASQTSVINQDLDGVAIADADQSSDIGQGETTTQEPQQ
jgi:hypothetical protein